MEALRKYIPNKYAALLLLYCFGSPGLVVYETNNMHVQSGFNTDRLLEIIMFGVTSFTLAIFYVTENKKLLAKIFSFNFFSYFSLILILYATYVPLTLLTANKIQFLEILFRISEWFICIVLAQSAIISLMKIKDRAERLDKLQKYMLIFCLTPISMTTIGFILGTDSSLFRYGTDVFRFGGQFFNPIYVSYFCILSIAIILSEVKLNIVNLLILISLVAVFYFTKTRQSLAATVLFLGLSVVANRVTNYSHLLGKLIIFVLTLSAAILALTFWDTLLRSATRTGDITEVLTLNNRTILWQSFIANFKITAIGEGFIIGGERYGNTILHATGHWRPSHPHNEFMNLYLSGGILSTFIGALIYGKILVDFCRFFNHRKFPKYILFSMFAILTFQAVTPLFSHALNIFGCFAILSLTSVSNYKLLNSNE